MNIVKANWAFKFFIYAHVIGKLPHCMSLVAISCMYLCMYTALITHQYVVQMGWKKLHLHES